MGGGGEGGLGATQGEYLPHRPPAQRWTGYVALVHMLHLRFFHWFLFNSQLISMKFCKLKFFASPIITAVDNFSQLDRYTPLKLVIQTLYIV